jgi:predicted MPP superfamily phosphohydrolase
MASRRPLKGVVDLTAHFGRLPGWVIVAAWLGAAGVVAWAWGNAWVGLVFGLFALGDGVMLTALPRLGRSYGPPQLPALSLTALRLVLALAVRILPIAGLAQLILSLVATYACWVEPARLGLTQLTLRSPRLNGCPPLRLLHISDLHVERITARERQLLRWVERLAPDVIVITGDYLNISYTYDATAQHQTRKLLSRLRAPRGVYAITGSPAVDHPQVVASLLEGLDLTWLRDEVTSLSWHGQRLQIAGVECSYDVEADEDKLRRLLDGRASDAFTLLLYHTPDVMPAAVQAGVDLYLAGHTHGGQLRLPFFGALVTASIYGKRYEMGAYRQGDTLLYVSRGVGLEGKGAPRARFLCPPEIVLFTLMGTETAVLPCCYPNDPRSSA